MSKRSEALERVRLGILDLIKEAREEKGWTIDTFMANQETINRVREAIVPIGLKTELDTDMPDKEFILFDSTMRVTMKAAVGQGEGGMIN
jgi:hypothetical protein